MAVSDFTKRLLKATGNPVASVFSKSAYADKLEGHIPLPIPMMNVAFSGRWDGGLCYGITIIAGESKHYKTGTGLVAVKAFQDKYEDGVVIYLDSELGAGLTYFDSLGIDKDRVIHIPVKDVEEAKFQCVKIMEEVQEGEKVFIFYDSLGNTASKKELQDAIDEKSVADMSRAKAIKSFFRILTPMINLKKCWLLAINHTYMTQEMFAKEIMSGGTGVTLSADSIYFMGRRQQKEDKELVGYEFVMKANKSRFVREGSTFPLNITFEDGIDKYSGLFDWAVENGFIESPTKGYYTRKAVPEDKKWRAKEIQRNDDFWGPVLTEEFKRAYEKSFSL